MTAFINDRLSILTKFNNLRCGTIIVILNILLICNNKSVYTAAIDDKNQEEINLNRTNADRTCSTEGCKKTESMFLNNIDHSVDPCNNFYKYACGNFEKNTILPKSETEVDLFTMAMDKVLDQVKKMVEENITSDEPRSFQLVKKYYSSCINTSNIEKEGLKPIKEILDKIGGWPVVLGNKWNEKKFNLEEIDGKLQMLGFSPNYIFHLYFMKDVQNNSRNILYLSSINFDLKEYLSEDLDDNITRAYYNYMINIAVMLGANRNRATVELKEALLFGIKLANSPSLVNNIEDDKMKTVVTIKQLQQNFPYLSWLNYLNNATYPNGNFVDTDEIRIDNPLYLEGVKRLLENTTKRVVANYLIWNSIADSVNYLNDEIRSTRNDFLKIFNGRSQSDSRVKYCLKSMIIDNVGLLVAINTMYIKKHFNETVKKDVDSIVSNIQRYYDGHLKNSSWLHNSTRTTALAKNKLMKRIVGYPDELNDVNFVDKYYKNLEFTSNNYFNNSMKLNNFIYQQMIIRSKKHPNETSWFDAGISSNIYPHYNGLHNTIVLPVLTLQHPFFSKDQPNYINYGSIGFLISHEMTHAFEFGSFTFDEHGLLKEWWSSEDQVKFYDKTMCFVTQYNGYNKEGSDRIDGFFTHKENIADIEGIKAAFNTYKIWRKTNQFEQLLQSLNYTEDQLFWLSAANTLCSKKTQESKSLKVITDVHSPEEFRVMGLASNLINFTESFNCYVNAPMNPVEKCSLF